MSTSPQLAFVTLVTTDQYLPGALVVAAALRDIHTSPPTAPNEFDPAEFHTICLVTPETVDVSTLKFLRSAFDVVIGVEVIEAETEEGLKLLGRLDLRTVLTKLHIFRLTSYRKLIYLDADVLPLRPLSHLFRLSSTFAAVPDVGWPDIFNSGFLVFEPGENKFQELLSLVKSKGSWDGGDQGVLNEWKGKEWDRLSFTYNTTPTAAYTYAPAYKRYGSQISNIHFIGPNKPWLQIPFRAPGVTSDSKVSGPLQSFAPPASYAYPTLLDRWFAVYDKHYRSPDNTPAFPSDLELISAQGNFTVQQYESVWDSDLRPTAGAEVSGAGAPLGLEELRRMAVEGVGGSGPGEGQGVYRSLPLEGRVDLMRPEKSQPVLKVKAPPTVHIQVPEGPQTPTRSYSPAPMTTLPTPGPREFPPTPVFRGQSLPPETPTHARARSPSPVPPLPKHLHAHSAHISPPRSASPQRRASPLHHAPPPRPVSPPLLSWNPAIEAPPTAPPPASHFPEQTYFPNVWDVPHQDQDAAEESGRFFPLPPQPSIPERLVREGHYKAVIGESQQDHARAHEHVHHQNLEQSQGHSHHEHRHHQDSHHEQQQQQQQPHHHHEPHHHDYHPSPRPSHPRPDRSKIATVFPWEEKPRHAPDRVFPQTDSPPPGQPFIKPEPPALKLDLHVTHPSPPMPQPSMHGFPRTTTYANAWDAVPSIQRYASRLVRPSPLATPFSAPWTAGTGRARKGSAATAGGNEYKSWEDRVEVSSRDADDEDDGEDEDEASPPSAGAGSDQSEGLEERPPRAEKKRYKGKSIQTIAQEMRHQGVQVPNGKRTARSASTRRGLDTSNEEAEEHHERALPPKLGRGLPQDMKVYEQMAAGSPALNAPGFMLPLGTKQQQQQPQSRSRQPTSFDEGPAPSGALSPRLHDAYAFGSLSHKDVEGPASPKDKVPATPELLPPVPAPAMGSASAAEQAASPPSSLGPTSPPDGEPILAGPPPTESKPPLPPRPAGRAFDPARGVDVFKKGSEEVLARFLRMGSWADDGPGSPSTT